MKAYYAGQKAFRTPKFYKGNTGKLLMEGNPYPDGSKDYKDWEFGYNKAYYEKLGTGSTRVS